MINFDLLNAECVQHPYPLLFATVSGAHLYGFPSPDSDYDLRGVHVLPAAEVFGLEEKRETVTLEAIRSGVEMDLVTHDAEKFFRLMLKRNGYVLEQLHSPIVVRTSPEHDELREIAHRCVTRHHVHHYLGFARTQWALFEKGDPPRIKPLLYVFRVVLTGIRLLRTGSVEANLATLNEEFRLHYVPELIERKVSGREKGTLEGTERVFYADEYRRLLGMLEEAGASSRLPEETTARPALSDLLIRIRRQTL